MVDKNFYIFLFALFISGCSIIPADKLNNKAAENVHISNKTANNNCRYVGEVYGGQGNWFTGLFTSNINILKGAINNLKNQSAANNANFVYLESSSTTDQTVLELISFGFYIRPFSIVNGAYNITLVGQSFSCDYPNKGGEKT